MKFVTTVNPDIPPLAWICTIARGDETVALECGGSVETREDWFFDGAWAGPFSQGGFLDTNCFGTGARLTKTGITFTTPDHILDRLYYIEDVDRLLISNSLPFVMQRAGKSLVPQRSDYMTVYGEIWKGLTNHSTALPMEDGTAVKTWAWFHMHVDTDLNITKGEKDRHVDLPDFAAYEVHMLDVMRRVLDNATDATRKQTYELLTMISSGYDSTAASALASDLGCKEALTFSKSRKKLGKRTESDSGDIAAGLLGLNLTPFDRLGFRSRSDFPEIDSLGAASELASTGALVEKKVLITGHLGDMMWDRQPAALSNDIVLPGLGGHNLSELRLMRDYIMFAPVYIGCRQQGDVVKISQSAEMAPWTLHNDYDRPIARRIGEDRGIPRDAFGIKKRATGVFFREEGLEQTMSPHSYADYKAFRLAQTGVSLTRAQMTDRLHRLGHFVNGVSSRLTRITNRLLKTRLKAPKLTITPGPNNEGAVLFQWAIARLKDRYPPLAD